MPAGEYFRRCPVKRNGLSDFPTHEGAEVVLYVLPYARQIMDRASREEYVPPNLIQIHRCGSPFLGKRSGGED